MRAEEIIAQIKRRRDAEANAGAEVDVADVKIAELAALSDLAYQKRRKEEAKVLGISVSALDKMVRRRRAVEADEEAALPHWKVEPWPDDVSGAELLDELWALFHKYIYLPAGGGRYRSTLDISCMDYGRW